MKREVVGCIGGGGNHLRWLLLLDPSFTYFRDVAPDNYSFIVNCVYPNDRNWQNWLNYEWRYRLEVENLIAFSHGRELQSDTRYCALKTSPTDALKHYIKFNTNLNTTLVDTFKQQTHRFNEFVESHTTNENLLVIESGDLFQSTLDRNLYERVVAWFNLSNNYTQAAEIHSIWWNLVKRAEQEIIQDLQKIYS